jgi:hypothetical protein
MKGIFVDTAGWMACADATEGGDITVSGGEWTS